MSKRIARKLQAPPKPHQPKSLKFAVQLKAVTKTYILHHEKPTFFENILHLDRRESFTAISKLSLKILPGERVGIIGPNGSGKTTLLKLIAGISQPTKGSITTRGRIVSLIDLEAGFHPDLTGEENIFLNGLIVGMTQLEIQTQFAAIVEFADIGQFIDSPLHTYSEGMKLRLGFAIAVHSQPDILILDEAMAVGDRNFQLKSTRKIREFFKAGKTIILVTHWVSLLRKHCSRIIFMDQGRITQDGDTSLLSLLN
jgi:ABC-type polysaccharide/polyol phosphate transport system ATPase subunit